jgi:hypothetical protein
MVVVFVVADTRMHFTKLGHYHQLEVEMGVGSNVAEMGNFSRPVAVTQVIIVFRRIAPSSVFVATGRRIHGLLLGQAIAFNRHLLAIA